MIRRCERHPLARFYDDALGECPECERLRVQAEAKRLELCEKTPLPPYQPTDPISWPAHYNQGSVECIDAMRSAFGDEAMENYCIVNAFKYVWRYQQKNGREDLKKAIWYLRFATGDDPRKDGRGE